MALIKMAFLFKTNKSDEVSTFLNKCFQLGLLGSKISIGTYLPDSIETNYILKQENLIDDYDLGGICVQTDDREHIKKDYKHLLGRDYTMVGLVEKTDIAQGDVPKKKYKDLNKALQALNAI
tara:strand:+ start:308 stop:673 length:366 start_codon:yes stop_codon:yes gene_type:complete